MIHLFFCQHQKLTLCVLLLFAFMSRTSCWYNSLKGMCEKVIKSIPEREPPVEKKVELKWKSVKNATKRAITDLNAPNGSWDIPFQSQEFGQDWHWHFVGFQPHFLLNMTSQTQCCDTMKKWKYNISGAFYLICLKLCKLLKLSKGIAMAAKIKIIVYYWKTKDLLFK